MATATLQVILLLLCGTTSIARAEYNYDYLDENCAINSSDGFTRDLASSSATYGFIQPVRQGGYPQGMDCTLTIKAPKHHYLIVKFRRLAIYQPTSKCNEDYLTIAGNSSTYRYCGYRTPSHSLISTTDSIQVRFVSNYKIDDNTRVGFEIYYTAFHRGECNKDGEDADEFRCRGNRCIPRELTCDHLDNCGDWSDERAHTCGLSKAMTICVSIVGALVVGTCAIGIFMCICAKKKERSAASRRQGDVVQVEYTRNGNGGQNGALGEKPPLPSYDNYAYSSGPVTPLSPQQFMPPPAYDSIDTAPARNQVAPGADVGRKQESAAPDGDVGRNQVAPMTGSDVAPSPAPAVPRSQGSARTDEMHGGYEDVDLGNIEQYEVVDLRDDDAPAASAAQGNDDVKV